MSNIPFPGYWPYTPVQIDGWAEDVQPTVKVEPKLPEHCAVCNHHNPYVGKEHMATTSPAYIYVCRSCKPGWERREYIARMKQEAAEREAKRNDYSGGGHGHG